MRTTASRVRTSSSTRSAGRRRRTVRRRKTYQLGVLRRRIGGHARKLTRSLGGMSAVPDRPPKCRVSPTALMINYGVSTMPAWAPETFRWVNNPYNVNMSADKLQCFRALMRADVPTLDWTTDYEDAYRWLVDGKHVFARTVLRGTRGEGIRVATTTDELRRAPLYTRNFPKTHEFRVHVAGGQVIDFVEKKARNGSDADRTVRNHAGGWVFAHEDLATTSGRLGDIAIRAVNACGLDFAGVDVLAVLEEGPRPRAVKKAVVCEVNSAPAWECTKTFFAYKGYFNGLVNTI